MSLSDEIPEIASIYPRRLAPVLSSDGERHSIKPMLWGVPLKVPGKREGTTIQKYVTNVRNLTSPFWKSTLAKPEQRCLVPFSRFAEPKPNGGRENIWFAVNEAPVSAFAGIWRPSEIGDVFAFLTCAPNPLVAEYHPKAMPVILHPEDYPAWLAGEEASKLAVPFPSQIMSVVNR